MNEITSYFATLLRELSAGRDVMAVTVTESLGSAPRGAGARMLVGSEGRITGTVGGGPIEYRAEQDAIGLLSGKCSARRVYNLSETSKTGNRSPSPSSVSDRVGMICGGTVKVAFHYLSSGRDDVKELCRSALGHLDAPENLWLIMELPTAAAAAAVPATTAVAVPTTAAAAVPATATVAVPTTAATVAAPPQSAGSGNLPLYIGICGQDSGTQTVVIRGQSGPGPLPSSVRERLAAAAPGILEAEGRTFYLELIAADRLVHVFGGGHVARELVPLLSRTGFTCAVYDDREEYVRREDFPDAFGTRVVSFDRLDGCLFPTAENYFVIMTRGHRFDLQAQAFAMGMPAVYIGVMGSRRKTELLTAKLLELGFDRKALNLVHAPIGVSIGAQTPAEIAVSITAELIRVRREHGVSKSSGGISS